MKIFYGLNSTVQEYCLWIKEGNVYICLSYVYKPANGNLTYAASIYRPENKGDKITDEIIENHEHTTTQRFIIRPVIVVVDTYLDYSDMIKIIRKEMTHGYGCKGVRMNFSLGNKSYCDDHSEASFATNSNYSEDEDALTKLNSYNEYSHQEQYKVTPETFDLKTIRKLRYFYTTKEKCGTCNTTNRDIFICFKGNSRNGDLLFGACIARYPGNVDKLMDDYSAEQHWKTAKARLEKSPVHMNISSEFRYQLKKNASHREDVMCEIMDKILTRKKGHFQIKGY